jgi:hypothetical protein
MSTDSGQDDLPKILARALLRVAEQYCEADLGGKLSEEVARLARLFLEGFLVERAREGMTDEGQLAVAGLQYLISLTRKPTSSKCSTKEEKTAEDGDGTCIFASTAEAASKFKPDDRGLDGHQNRL